MINVSFLNNVILLLALDLLEKTHAAFSQNILMLVRVFLSTF